jgi:hypothetical protein
MTKSLMSCNTKKLRRALLEKAKIMSAGEIDIVVEEANRIMEESRLEVPVDSGTLQSIADVVVVRYSPTSADVVIGYGVNGDVYNAKSKQWASKYARLIHEDLSLNHPNGHAKFFSVPVARGRVRIRRRIKALVRSVVK